MTLSIIPAVNNITENASSNTQSLANSTIHKKVMNKLKFHTNYQFGNLPPVFIALAHTLLFLRSIKLITENLLDSIVFILYIPIFM